MKTPFCGALVAAAVTLGLGAQQARGASASAFVDRSPELVSRTGGGGATWSDVKELAAAAEKGNPEAQAQYGELLLRGQGVPRDVRRAVELIEKAARAGQAPAAFRMGMLLVDGDGVPQDRARALAYFRAAAAGGVSEAYYNLGAAYASGRGVKRDYAEALAWLILARKRGAPDAEGELRLREHIQKLKRPEWITAGEAKVPELERELSAGGVVGFLPGNDTSAAAGSPATGSGDTGAKAGPAIERGVIAPQPIAPPPAPGIPAPQLTIPTPPPRKEATSPAPATSPSNGSAPKGP